MNERGGVRERSEQCEVSKQVSGAREQANGRASGPVLTSRFLAVLNHLGMARGVEWKKGMGKTMRGVNGVDRIVG